MVQWETRNGKSVEVGLSPGQTEGEVGGSYVVRPESSDVTKVYKSGVGSTSILIEGGAKLRRGERGVTTITRRDQYGNVIGVKRVGASGETIFERKLRRGEGAVEEGLPFDIQRSYAKIERTKSELPMYRRQAEYKAKTKEAVLTKPTFQLPIFSEYRYGVRPKGTFTVLEGRTSQEYYKTYPFMPKEGIPRISEPLQSFGKNIFGQPQGKPEPGKTYRKDWLGNYVEVSPREAKVVSKEKFEAIKTADIYAPFFVAPSALTTTSALRGASLKIRMPSLKQKITYDMKALEGMALVPKKKTRLQLLFKETKTEVQPKIEVIDLSKAEPLPSSKYKTTTNIFSGGEQSLYSKKAFAMDVAFVRAQEARTRALSKFNLGSLSLLSRNQKYRTESIPSLLSIQNNIFRQQTKQQISMKMKAGASTSYKQEVKLESLYKVLSKSQLQHKAIIKTEPTQIRFHKRVPIKFRMPSFEMPAIFGQGRRRRYKTKEKVIVTQMLSLKDIFG